MTNQRGNLKKNVMVGLLWKTTEQYGLLFVQFILQIFLARILEPEDYGIIAVVNVFISLSNVFIQNGFAIAIVQKKKIDDYDLSSIFWTSELIGLLLYVILYLSAPYLASFYNLPILTSLIRVMSLVLFLSGYTSIQNALIRRGMYFKDSCFINTLAISISGVCGILAAIYDLGVWSLAVQQILFAFLTLLLSFFILRWKPMIYFEASRVKKMIDFGGKVLLTSLIDELFVNYRNLLIGKFYTSADLSFYNKGQSFPGLILRSINGALSTVLLPVMAKVQDNKNDVTNILKTSTLCSTFIIFPILTILFVSSPNIIELLLTDKWLPAVIYLRIFCFYYATWPISTLNMQTLYAVGRPDMVFKLEVIRKVLDLLVILLTLNVGVVAIAVGSAAVSMFALIIYLIPCGRITGYFITEQIRDIFPNIIGCLLISPIVYIVGRLATSPMISLLLQLLFGCVSFYFYARFFHIKSLDYIVKAMKSSLKRGM